jgi:hypothetical protein
MVVSKECISLAAEFAVASELCRRGIYTQLTFGNKKRTDLLVISGNKNLMRIEVKAKQGREWPNCKGIFGKDVFLVLVDYANCDETERPDFYVLTSEDWLKMVKKGIQKYNEKYPERRVEIDSENVPIFLDEVNKYGKPYRGIGIKPEMIQEHKETWFKISKKVKNS